MMGSYPFTIAPTKFAVRSLVNFKTCKLYFTAKLKPIPTYKKMPAKRITPDPLYNFPLYVMIEIQKWGKISLRRSPRLVGKIRPNYAPERSNTSFTVSLEPLYGEENEESLASQKIAYEDDEEEICSLFTVLQFTSQIRFLLLLLLLIIIIIMTFTNCLIFSNLTIHFIN
jgi:hypothetical protein